MSFHISPGLCGISDLCQLLCSLSTLTWILSGTADSNASVRSKHSLIYSLPCSGLCCPISLFTLFQCLVKTNLPPEAWKKAGTQYVRFQFTTWLLSFFCEITDYIFFWALSLSSFSISCIFWTLTCRLVVSRIMHSKMKKKQKPLSFSVC